MAPEAKRQVKADAARSTVAHVGHDLTIGRDAWRPREVTNNDWTVRVGGHVTGEMLQRQPALWANAPPGLQSFDILRVIGPERWWEVLVRKFIPGAVCQIVVLREVELPKAEEHDESADPSGYLTFHDDVGGWSVRRLSDESVIADSRTHPEWHSRRDAQNWVHNSAPVRQRGVIDSSLA